MELGALGAVIVLGCLLTGFIGYAIGNTRGRGGEGALLGIFLGPIGWVIALLLPATGSKCPGCLGVVPEGARRCKHCGVAFTRPIAPPPDASKFYVIVKDKTEGPFTIQQLRYFMSVKRISAETMTAREGDPQWVPLADFL